MFVEKFYRDGYNDDFEVIGDFTYMNKSIGVRHKTCGHEFTRTASQTTPKLNCPECDKVKRYEKRREQYIEKFYRDEHNEDYSIESKYTGMNGKVTIKHKHCGGEFTKIASKTIPKTNCPHCYPKYRDKRSKSPEQYPVGKFTQEDFESRFYENPHNQDYEVIGKYVRMVDPIKLKHKECGYEFTRLGTRTTPKVYCPKCNPQSRNKRTNQMFIKEIEEKVGEEYRSLEEYIDTDTKIKMLHTKCGNSWDIAPNIFLNQGIRCPECATGGVARDHKWFMDKVRGSEYYDPEYVFVEEYHRYDTKIKIQHLKCNHVYKVSPNKFLQGRRCPRCLSSRGERRVAMLLERYNVDFEMEKAYDDLRIIHPMRFDFYVNDQRHEPFLIEYDGEQHFIETQFGGLGSTEIDLKEIQSRDKMKDDYARDNNIPLYRIPYTEIDNIHKIVPEILARHKL